MAKVLMQYGKENRLSYLSHLETIKALERSFRRAGIDIRMSGGFNPRPKVSHCPALPVGVGSCAEYMVADLKNPVPENYLLERLSSALPQGLSIYRAKYINEGQGSVTDRVQCAAYSIKIETGSSIGDIQLLIDQLRQKERLLVVHKDKEKWVETNQAILDWRVEGESGRIFDFYMLLSMGDRNSIRPDVTIGKLSETFPQLNGIDVLKVFRKEQYANRDIPLINIYDFYEGVKMGSEHYKS